MADEKRPEKEGSEEEKEGKQNRKRKVGPVGPGDPVRIHEDYIRRHLEGGAPATREAYERAMEQWRKLPGAVVSTPRSVEPEIKPSEEEETPEDPNRQYDQKESPNDPKAGSS
jgi:hypothetical protein